jgi:hypothetical protein
MQARTTSEPPGSTAPGIIPEPVRVHSFPMSCTVAGDAGRELRWRVPPPARRKRPVHRLALHDRS